MAEKPPKTPFSVVTSLPLQIPDPPQPLGPAGLQLWQAIQGEYNIIDQGGITMLLVGCLAYDRAERLRACIDADGDVIHTRSGVPKAHPAIKDEIGCRAQVMRAIEKLGLNYEAIKSVGRPPGSFNR
jgi:phage terminase small subunit